MSLPEGIGWIHRLTKIPLVTYAIHPTVWGDGRGQITWKQLGKHPSYCYVRVPKGISTVPIPSMYGIFTYIWLMFMVNVGKYGPYMDPMG